MTTQELLLDSTVRALLRQWASEQWDENSVVAGVLADALEERDWETQYGRDEWILEQVRLGNYRSLPDEFTEIDVVPELRSRDWREAFAYAKDADFCPSDATGLPSEFTRQEVAEVLALELGENDEANWEVVGRLKNGAYFHLSAGCDFTGWDCQAWGECQTSETLRDLIRYGLSDSERQRLKLQPEG